MTDTTSAATQPRFAGPKPCMGYPSQTEAVIALYEAANHPKLIAKRTGLALNSVYRAISDYRKSTGRAVAPSPYQAEQESRLPTYNRMWDMEEARLRQAIMAKARRGAKLTLLAAAS